MLKLIKRLLVEDDGPTAVEYAVLLALIVIACMGAVNTLANSTAASYNYSASEIQSALSS
jgi:pilus assembly protein Flp/PilA